MNGDSHPLLFWIDPQMAEIHFYISLITLCQRNKKRRKPTHEGTVQHQDSGPRSNTPTYFRKSFDHMDNLAKAL